MKKIKVLEFPPMPRQISGLKKDGTKDKRYKRGNTMIELKEYMDKASGLVHYLK